MAEGIILILGLILLVIGILLAFFGRAMWESVMSMIGGFIGWFLGFYFAAYVMHWNWLIAIIVGFIGGFIGSMIFGRLIEVALALITGALAGGLLYVIGGPGWAIPAVIVFAVVFALSYYYIDDLIAVITALIGGILSAAAVFVIMDDAGMAVLAGIAIFILGAVVQTYALEDHDRHRRGRSKRTRKDNYQNDDRRYR